MVQQPVPNMKYTWFELTKTNYYSSTYEISSKEIVLNDDDLYIRCTTFGLWFATEE